MKLTALRCLLVWGGVSIGSAATIGWALPDAEAIDQTSLDSLLGAGAGVALAACAAWFCLVTTVVIAETLRDLARRQAPRTTSRAPAPTWVRRVVLAACGLTLISAGISGPAFAGSADTGASVDGLPFPDRTYGVVIHHTERQPSDVDPAVPPPPPAPTPPWQVAAGDSLWSISHELMGEGATTSEIADAVDALYERNREVIGADPDLISTGQRLYVPTSLAASDVAWSSDSRTQTWTGGATTASNHSSSPDTAPIERTLR